MREGIGPGPLWMKLEAGDRSSTESHLPPGTSVISRAPWPPTEQVKKQLLESRDWQLHKTVRVQETQMKTRTKTPRTLSVRKRTLLKAEFFLLLRLWGAGVQTQGL